MGTNTIILRKESVPMSSDRSSTSRRCPGASIEKRSSWTRALASNCLGRPATYRSGTGVRCGQTYVNILLLHTSVDSDVHFSTAGSTECSITGRRILVTLTIRPFNPGFP